MTEKPPSLYCFGYSEECQIPCAELDEFLDDLWAVLEKHRVGLQLKTAWSEYDDDKIVLCAYEDADLSPLIDDLNEYKGGIPWLDDAKKRWQEKYETMQRERASLEELKAKKLEEARADAQARKEKHAIENGVVVGGKAYKLVEIVE